MNWSGVKDNKLSDHEVAVLQNDLRGLKYNFSFTTSENNKGVCHPDNEHKEFDVIDERTRRANIYHLSTGGKGLRVHANGKVEVLGRNITFNLNTISDPPSFFRDLAAYIELDITKTKELQKISGDLLLKNVSTTPEKGILCHIDEIAHEPKKLTIRGWCFDQKNRNVDISLIFPDGAAVPVKYSPEQSPDVEKHYGNVAHKCRFFFEVNLNYSFPLRNHQKEKII